LEIILNKKRIECKYLNLGNEYELNFYNSIQEKNEGIDISNIRVSYVVITKKIANVYIPKNIISEINNRKLLPIHLRIAPDFTLGYYNESEIFDICDVDHIKGLLCFWRVDNLDYMKLVDNVFRDYNSRSVKVKCLDNGNVQQEEYRFYEKNEINFKKATTYKKIIEELLYGENIFRSTHIPLTWNEYFEDNARYYIVYKDGTYYELTIKSYSEDMLPPEYYYTIDAVSSKSFDSIWNSLDNNIKCEILKANYKSVLSAN
jgi:hypothetical protein